jgi:hypothetical protein
MRTTVDIPDAKYRLLKSKAAMQGKTVKQLLLRGVDAVLLEIEAKPVRVRKLKHPLIPSKRKDKFDADHARIYEYAGLA